MAEEYAGIFSIGSQKYKIVLQCRVEPNAIRECPDRKVGREFWVINDPKNIRPYGICVKPVE